MRVYIAAPYAARDRLRELLPDLTRQRMSCTSSWLGEIHEVNNGTTGAATEMTDQQVARHARMDIADVRRSHALVLFTAKALDVRRGGHTGGRHVETGLALGLGLPIVVVGEPENVFHRLGDYGRGRVSVVDDWASALTALAAHRDRINPPRVVR